MILRFTPNAPFSLDAFSGAKNSYEEFHGIRNPWLISPLFYEYANRPGDIQFVQELLSSGLEGTPGAIKLFEKRQNQLSPYQYWFCLSTLWVSYSGWFDLKRWRRLFKAHVPHRDQSIMKPYELHLFNGLPEVIHVYRAHRAGETDWISYTTDLSVAENALLTRPGGWIGEYEIRREDCLAYFLRRNEYELIELSRKDQA